QHPRLKLYAWKSRGVRREAVLYYGSLSPEGKPVRRFISVCALALFVTACNKSPPAPTAAATSPEDQFTALEHEYMVYVMGQFPVVATYLGGSAFDPALAGIDAKLRDYSAPALTAENEKLRDFRKRFDALPEADLSARRKIDRSVALAQIDFLLRQH